MTIHRISLAMMAVALGLAACSDSNDDDPSRWICIYPTNDGPHFTYDADSIPRPTPFTPMTADAFAADIVGHGWLCTAMQRITAEGAVEADNLVGELIGIGPTHYYIGPSALTRFFYADHLGYINGGMMHAETAYDYDPATGLISTPDDPDVLLLIGHHDLGSGGRYLTARHLLGAKASGTPVYCLATYRCLSAAELSDLRRTYSATPPQDGDR